MIMISRATRFLAALELPIVIAIAPALLFPTPTRMLVLAVVPMLWAANRAVGRGLVPSTPLNAAIWLLLGMVGVSLLATFDVLLFWALARWLTTPARLQLSVAAFVLAGAALALVGLIGTEASYKFPVLSMIAPHLPLRIRGLPGAEDGFNPNAVAGCLVLIVPLQVGLLAGGGNRWWRSSRAAMRAPMCVVTIQVGLLLLTAGAVLLMQSRGAWVGLIVASLAALLWRRRTRIPGVVLVAATIVGAVALGPGWLANVVITRSGSGAAGTAAARVELWARGIYGIEDFPFTGMGMNTFRKVMPVMYPPFLVPADADIAHAHNHLLQAALDLGIPGLVAYVALWLLAAVLLVVVYRRSPAQIHRTLAASLGAGLIAHFTFGMTDAIPLGAKIGALFWVTLALVVGLHRVSATSASPTPDPPSPPSGADLPRAPVRR
jgi:putative inorganic carbon (HCO3(-)) transporter